MDEDLKTQHLSVFLVKPECSSLEEIIRVPECSKHLPLDIPELGTCHLFAKIGQEDYPRWVSLFDGIFDSKEIGKVHGVSAAFVIKTSNRFFVLTFGQAGRFLLQEGAIESKFGLIVTLNSVARESLRCIDKQSLDNLESQSRIQSSYETSTDQFGIDVEQDMLKAVVGSPSNKKMGSRMTGADSLSVSVKTDVYSLKPLLDLYLKKFNEDISEKGYDWVNNISNIRNNPVLIEILEALLDEKLRKKDLSNIWLSIPEIIEWDLVKGFMFSGGRQIIYPDITFDNFLNCLKGDELTLDILKDRRVFCADEDHHHVYRSWPIYKCLYAELDFDGGKYVLNDRKWFRIEPDFEKKTNSKYEKIDRSNLKLPTYQHDNEGVYNQKLAESMPDEYALLDDKNKVFHGGGHGQVEVCDLFSAKKNLIHIKRYGKSSVLSHLFSQGFVSGQLIQLDDSFRTKFKSKLPNSFKHLVDETKRPSDKEYTITFAIISEDQQEGLHLPFFSRVNINNTHRILSGYGYNVELLKIKEDPVFSKTTKCKPKKIKRNSRTG